MLTSLEKEKKIAITGKTKGNRSVIAFTRVWKGKGKVMDFTTKKKQKVNVKKLPLQ